MAIELGSVKEKVNSLAHRLGRKNGYTSNGVPPVAGEDMVHVDQAPTSAPQPLLPLNGLMPIEANSAIYAGQEITLLEGPGVRKLSESRKIEVIPPDVFAGNPRAISIITEIQEFKIKGLLTHKRVWVQQHRYEVIRDQPSASESVAQEQRQEWVFGRGQFDDVSYGEKGPGDERMSELDLIRRRLAREGAGQKKPLLEAKLQLNLPKNQSTPPSEPLNPLQTSRKPEEPVHQLPRIQRPRRYEPTEPPENQGGNGRTDNRIPRQPKAEPTPNAESISRAKKEKIEAKKVETEPSREDVEGAYIKVHAKVWKELAGQLREAGFTDDRTLEVIRTCRKPENLIKGEKPLLTKEQHKQLLTFPTETLLLLMEHFEMVRHIKISTKDGSYKGIEEKIPLKLPSGKEILRSPPLSIRLLEKLRKEAEDLALTKKTDSLTPEEEDWLSVIDLLINQFKMANDAFRGKGKQHIEDIIDADMQRWEDWLPGVSSILRANPVGHSHIRVSSRGELKKLPPKAKASTNGEVSTKELVGQPGDLLNTFLQENPHRSIDESQFDVLAKEDFTTDYNVDRSLFVASAKDTPISIIDIPDKGKNQDSLAYERRSDGIVNIAVADGVTGAVRGDLSSRIAVRAVVEQLRDQNVSLETLKYVNNAIQRPDTKALVEDLIAYIRRRADEATDDALKWRLQSYADQITQKTKKGIYSSTMVIAAQYDQSNNRLCIAMKGDSQVVVISSEGMQPPIEGKMRDQMFYGDRRPFDAKEAIYQQIDLKEGDIVLIQTDGSQIAEDRKLRAKVEQFVKNHRGEPRFDKMLAEMIRIELRANTPVDDITTVILYHEAAADQPENPAVDLNLPEPLVPASDDDDPSPIAVQDPSLAWPLPVPLSPTFQPVEASKDPEESVEIHLDFRKGKSVVHQLKEALGSNTAEQQYVRASTEQLRALVMSLPLPKEKKIWKFNVRDPQITDIGMNIDHGRLDVDVDVNFRQALKSKNAHLEVTLGNNPRGGFTYVKEPEISGFVGAGEAQDRLRGYREDFIRDFLADALNKQLTGVGEIMEFVIENETVRIEFKKTPLQRRPQ